MNRKLLVVWALTAVASGVVAQDKGKAAPDKDKKPAAAPAPAAKTGNDRVTRTGKPVVKGTIVSENAAEVVIKKDNGLEEKIPANEIISVDRGDAPEAYRKGVGAVASGDAANAVQLLKLALEQAKDKPWLAEAANCYLGEAQLALGKFDEAVSAFEAVAAAKADSRWLGLARMGAARAHMAAGKPADAEKALAAFVQEADAKKVPRRIVLQAREMQGANLEAQNRFGEASGVYDAVVREAQNVLKDDPSVADRIRAAQRAKASCLIREKKFDDAGRVLDSLANEKTPESETLVLSGRGELAYAQGKFDEARFHLGRVLGAKFQADREIPRAKLLMAKTLMELDKAGDKTAGRSAQFYLNDLVQRDAASEAAKEARALLSKSSR
jgi:tetratricopeptide (TPR) repeat protein